VLDSLDSLSTTIKMGTVRTLSVVLFLFCLLTLNVESRITNRRRSRDDPAAAPPAAAAPGAAPADPSAAGAAPAAGAAGAAPPAGAAGAAATPTTPGAPGLADPSANDAQIAGLAVKPSDAFDNPALQPSPFGQELDTKLSRASDLLNKMQSDVSTEKDWAKSVHDIIENYQFKYSKSLSDIAEREKRVAQLKEVKDQITQARLHTGVEEDMDRATKDLDALTARLGADAPASKDYSDLKNKVTKIKKKLDALSPNAALDAKDADQKINDAVSPHIPPASTDALAPLVNGDADAVAASDAAASPPADPAAAGADPTAAAAAAADPAAPAATL